MNVQEGKKIKIIKKKKKIKKVVINTDKASGEVMHMYGIIMIDGSRNKMTKRRVSVVN